MSADPLAPLLLTSPQPTTTGSLLTEAAGRRGMSVHVLTDLRRLDNLIHRHVHWYGGPLTADRIAGPIGLGLLEPPDDWLTRLPEQFTGRRITLTTLEEAWTLRRPAFVKPPSDKSFPAAVYTDGSRLPRSGERIGPRTPALISAPMTFTAEYRLFLLDHRITAASRYAVHGRCDPAPLDHDPHEHAIRQFVEQLLAQAGSSLPSAVAVDIGLIQDQRTTAQRWAVVEANMAWFAHSYAAQPDAVLDVVLRATGPRHRFTHADRPFLRSVPRDRCFAAGSSAEHSPGT